tara:strand:- start:1818 stop:2414 length:597 start_codon:yes stop_codon:yes gene_type:complete
MGLNYGVLDLITGGAGGIMQGLGAGLAIGGPAAVPIGVLTGVSAALASAMGILGKKKEYNRVKRAMRREYGRTKQALAIKRALQKRETRGGQKGIGGGHDIRDEMSTIHKTAKGRTKELGDIEQQAAADRYYTARAMHRARKKRGGAPALLNVLSRGLSGLASTGAFDSEGAPGGDYTGSYTPQHQPYSQWAVETPVF